MECWLAVWLWAQMCVRAQAMPTAQASLTSWCTRRPRWPSRQRQRALASTDVSGSVPAVSYGDRDLGADAGMKGYHATTQVFSTSPAFALILLTLDAWKRMQMPELQRMAERPAPRRATCPKVCVLCYFSLGSDADRHPQSSHSCGSSAAGRTRSGSHYTWGDADRHPQCSHSFGSSAAGRTRSGSLWPAPMHLLYTRSPLWACATSATTPPSSCSFPSCGPASRWCRPHASTAR